MSATNAVAAVNRRELLLAGASLPLALAAGASEAGAAVTRTPPPYTISINIEIMFPRAMSRADRIKAVAANGFKAYSFWSAAPADRAAMVKAQQDTGLTCVSLVGTGNAGGTTGFTRPGAQEALLAEFRELSVYGPGSSKVFAPLSPREVQILDNIAQGMTNKEVAYTLAISEQTVKNHMSSILRKLSVNDRTQAVVYAIRQGWIKGPEMGN